MAIFLIFFFCFQVNAWFHAHAYLPWYRRLHTGRCCDSIPNSSCPHETLRHSATASCERSGTHGTFHASPSRPALNIPWWKLGLFEELYGYIQHPNVGQLYGEPVCSVREFKEHYYLLSLFLDCTGSEVCIALDDPVNNTKEVSKCLAKYC